MLLSCPPAVLLDTMMLCVDTCAGNMRAVILAVAIAMCVGATATPHLRPGDENIPMLGGLSCADMKSLVTHYFVRAAWAACAALSVLLLMHVAGLAARLGFAPSRPAGRQVPRHHALHLIL